MYFVDILDIKKKYFSHKRITLSTYYAHKCFIYFKSIKIPTPCQPSTFK